VPFATARQAPKNAKAFVAEQVMTTTKQDSSQILKNLDDSSTNGEGSTCSVRRLAERSAENQAALASELADTAGFSAAASLCEARMFHPQTGKNFFYSCRFE
jgi:hypothetical protein